VSGRTRVRCPQPLQPRCPDRAGSGIRRCGGTGHIGAPGWTCRCGRCAAWSSLPESGLAGRDGRTLAVRGSHEGRRPTWTATWYAYRLRRRARCSATMGAGPAPVPVGWRGSRGRSGCSQVPRRCGLGRVPAYWPTMGLDREVMTTLRGGALVLVPCRPALEALSGSPGSRPRPQRGRGMSGALSARN
jgi:hypothetical protein